MLRSHFTFCSIHGVQVIFSIILQFSSLQFIGLYSTGKLYDQCMPMALLDDDVYITFEEACEEYVSEDVGLIWRGSHNRLRPTPWAYSQFEKNVLDCALYLLSNPAHLSPSARANPIKVARAISAAVCD